MAKFPTHPTLYDSCKIISISFLNKNGYLEPNQCKSGTLIFSVKGNETGSISITTNTATENPYIEFNYNANGTPIKYRVQLVSAPSNLGKGVVRLFVCPSTGKYCRKLYLVGTHFYHRSAFRGCMYYNQTLGHKHRMLHKIFTTDKAFKQLNSKHFKKSYNGMPTKRYLQILKQIKKGNAISILDFCKKLH